MICPSLSGRCFAWPLLMDLAPCNTNTGRIIRPLFFGVYMLRFLLLFLISPVVFAYCPNIDLASYPVGTADTLCVDYLGTYCEAVCGANPSYTMKVCVENSGKKGPYWLTGNSCTPSSGGTVDCTLTPTDPACTSGGGTVDCTLTPSDPACASGGGTVDCTLTPSDPACASGGGVVDCSTNPSDPSCSTVDCVNQPSNPACASDFSADISGYYHDSNGKVRSILLNSNFGDDIATASSKITDSISNLSHSVSNSSPAPLLSSIDLKLSSLSTTNSLLQTIDNSIHYLTNQLDNASSGSSSTSDDSAITDWLSQNNAVAHLQLDSMNRMDSKMTSSNNLLTSIHSFSSDSMIYLRSIDHTLDNVSDLLDDIDSTLYEIGSGGGSGGGEGEGSGPSVGTAENPAHIASSLYKPCTDCIVDVDGAKAELEASKDKLKSLNKTIQTEFKDIFTFDSASGSGSSAIASCWDFGSLIGQKCMQLDETWAVLKALVLFIFMIAIIFMFMRGD